MPLFPVPTPKQLAEAQKAMEDAILALSGVPINDTPRQEAWAYLISRQRGVICKLQQRNELAEKKDKAAAIISKRMQKKLQRLDGKSVQQKHLDDVSKRAADAVAEAASAKAAKESAFKALRDAIEYEEAIFQVFRESPSSGNIF
jgi:hypothetical protein